MKLVVNSILMGEMKEITLVLWGDTEIRVRFRDTEQSLFVESALHKQSEVLADNDGLFVVIRMTVWLFVAYSY